MGPNSSANTHSKIILTIPVSTRGYQTGDEQGTSLGLSFAHERLRRSHRRKMNCLLFFNCNFLCEWSPPGSAAREPHRKPGGEQLTLLALWRGVLDSPEHSEKPKAQISGSSLRVVDMKSSHVVLFDVYQ